MTTWTQRAKSHLLGGVANGAASPTLAPTVTTKTPLSVVMGAPHPTALEIRSPLLVVSEVSSPASFQNTQMKSAANADRIPALTEVDVEFWEERSAILEYDANQDRKSAERDAFLLLLKGKGVIDHEAQDLADLLFRHDSRRLCFECKHLQGYGHWRCSNALQADVSVSSRSAFLSKGLTHQLQNCPGFQALIDSEERL